MAATAAAGAYPMNGKHVQWFVAKGTCTADWLSCPVLSCHCKAADINVNGD
jgi:hypothetical protein